ncbi:nitrogenase component 1 [Desulfosporosinus shakirovi]|uniref:nitrogenase component 1 n=1 Tax=Desulfosporosinus shakirovi TaxID=2885154 RepID=UPI001E5C846A|nr:nitrogenase component 1 [Desulfosporosinus sp. SRJS8]MCB8816081.1 nitrogenase component 1 [Desulfosporosinus sp. SRJS8]
MSCSVYIKTSSWEEKIKLADIEAKLPLNSFFDRGIAEDDCGELVNLALCVRGIDVLAAGPSSCSRVLYFRAAKKRLNERLFLLQVSSHDFAAGKHLEKLEEALEGLVSSRRSKAIIVYITCADILTGTDFVGITKRIETQYGIPVKIFERGPLSRRRTLPKERLGDIFIDLLQRGISQEEQCHINVLGDAGKLPQYSGLRQIFRNYCSSEKIREFAALDSYEEFEDLANGKLNIALDSFGYDLAVRMRKKWDIPLLYLPAQYNMKDIKHSYSALMEGLQVTWDYSQDTHEYHRLAAGVTDALDGKRIAVGIGPRSFELAHTLELIGLPVEVIFAETANKQDMTYIEALAFMGSKAEVYLVSNIAFETQTRGFEGIDIAIGEKAAFYCLTSKEVLLSVDYHFGYEGILGILEGMR